MGLSVMAITYGPYHFQLIHRRERWRVQIGKALFVRSLARRDRRFPGPVRIAPIRGGGWNGLWRYDNRVLAEASAADEGRMDSGRPPEALGLFGDPTAPRLQPSLF